MNFVTDRQTKGNVLTKEQLQVQKIKIERYLTIIIPFDSSTKIGFFPLDDVICIMP